MNAVKSLVGGVVALVLIGFLIFGSSTGAWIQSLRETVRIEWLKRVAPETLESYLRQLLIQEARKVEAAEQALAGPLKQVAELEAREGELVEMLRKGAAELRLGQELLDKGADPVVLPNGQAVAMDILDKDLHRRELQLSELSVELNDARKMLSHLENKIPAWQDQIASARQGLQKKARAITHHAQKLKVQQSIMELADRFASFGITTDEFTKTLDFISNADSGSSVEVAAEVDLEDATQRKAKRASFIAKLEASLN